MTAWIILVYGILVAVGGVIGYTKANSVPSLLAGGISGLLLIGAAILMMRGPNQMAQIGWWGALIIAALLLVRFGMASLNNFKMMPGGLMIILSLIAIITLVVGRNQPSA